MHKLRVLLGAVAGVGLIAGSAQAQTLVVSSWGGSWEEMVQATIAEKFKEMTGADVEFVTGGTIDRLNRARLAKGDPESDVTLTTSHVGWLYYNDGLFVDLDYDKIPNASEILPEAKISPGHVGIWSYVYTIGYRPDAVPEGVTFSSWEDLWSPELEGTIGLPDFDPSHIIAVSALLSGAEVADWEEGSEKLEALKPNIKAYYTNDASSQQMIASGETPVQVLLSGNAFYQMDQGIPIELVIPEEGAIIGIDTVGIMAGTQNEDLAYAFIDAAFDPEVQAEITELKKLGPMNPSAEIPEELDALPGVLTSAEEWESDAIVIDHELRAELLPAWKQWFTENMIAGN